MRHLIGEASLVTQMVKNLPAMQETWVQSRGWEDSLERAMATHSSYSMDSKAWLAILHGVAELDTTERLTLHHHTSRS